MHDASCFQSALACACTSFISLHSAGSASRSTRVRFTNGLTFGVAASLSAVAEVPSRSFFSAMRFGRARREMIILLVSLMARRCSTVAAAVAPSPTAPSSVAHTCA